MRELPERLAAELDDDGADELRAALRRALLLLAAGGDPHRRLDPDGRAVRALADDLVHPALAAPLERALAALPGAAELLGDDALARRWAALELLADELVAG
jgi:hypothetical protein